MWLEVLVCINAANKGLLSSSYFQLKTMQLQSCCANCGFSHGSSLGAMKSFQNHSSLQAPVLRESFCEQNKKYLKQCNQHLFPTSQLSRK